MRKVPFITRKSWYEFFAFRYALKKTPLRAMGHIGIIQFLSTHLTFLLQVVLVF
ncbi:MAG: hypothetical protein PXX83_07040 [Candidatus Nitrosotalea sp.]|nr:hypothetical protein [Candidatus Nitrosotalea sp.]